MERRHFLDIFQEHPDGSLSPKMAISVNGVAFHPGVAFRPGIAFGGIIFHQYKYLDIAVEENEETLVIKGFYDK